MASAKVLVVGGGGREHALVWKLTSERGVAEVVCAPGNAGIARLARCVGVDAADARAVLRLADREHIDLTIVGPELPLSRGIADALRQAAAFPCPNPAARAAAERFDVRRQAERVEEVLLQAARDRRA